MTVSQTELNDFTRAFSSRVDSGESLTTVLGMLSTTATNPALSQAAADLVSELRGGATLSQGMTKHPSLFDDEYRVVIRRGELTGRLDDALRILA